MNKWSWIGIVAGRLGRAALMTGVLFGAPASAESARDELTKNPAAGHWLLFIAGVGNSDKAVVTEKWEVRKLDP